MAMLKAYLYAAAEPNTEQRERFLRFISKKYKNEYELVWVPDDMMGTGFKLVVGEEVYNWTSEARYNQLKHVLDNLNAGKAATGGELISLIRSTVKDWKAQVVAEEEGIVKTVGDGIAIVEGLSSAVYGEIVVFDCGVKGMIQDLTPGEVGVILFGDDTEITEGSKVMRTNRTAGIPVGDAYLGRVIDALGNPIDGKGEIKADGYRAIESPAPGIIDRKSVDTPMNTGILSIDSMFPIGRGQRELIIGDRQTGKTAIALDTILNQKGNGVVCIYVAIGQKASSVAQLVGTLQKAGAMDYTIVVNAAASETAPVQYIAPYAGTAMGEYFMNKGKDVLIVYDDLSKHAIAYRALSLLLERSPGREAYPGDVFYLHSRLLERSARLSDNIGGGSMTALPIVETQAGDVSAYIPTNIISITDGQIFLESDLFNEGQRPAVNVGLSVSRVGGSAQIKAMKKIAAPIRVELAQYRELAAFAQFGSELDAATSEQLAQGARIKEILKQPQYKPMPVEKQIIIIYAATKKYLLDIAVEDILRFESELFASIDTKYPEIPEAIVNTKVIDEETEAKLVKAIEECKAAFK